MSRPRLTLRESVLVSLGSLCGALFALRTLISSSGVPAFRHDWFWPMTGTQLRDAVYSNISAWDTSGMGNANVLPVNHPVFWWWHYAAEVISPHAVLACTLIAVFLLLSLGTYAFLRRATGASPGVCFIIALAMMLSAPVYTKLTAGHLYYLVSFCVSPWALYVALGAERRAVSAAGCGLLLALTIIQLQIYAITLLAVFLFMAADGPRRLRLFPLSVAASLLLAIPAIFLEITIKHAGAANFSQLQTLTFWEYNNSAHPLDAVVGLGYFAAYASNAFKQLGAASAVAYLLYIVPLLSLMGIALCRKNRLVYAAAILWLLCFCLVCGYYGPLSHPLDLAFHRWVWFSMFRELYHFAAPMWLFAGVLCAAALSKVPLRIGYAVAALAAIPALALWIPPNFAGALHSWPTDPHFYAEVARLAKRPGADRFIVLPAQNPVAPAGFRSGGVNSYAYAVGTHAPANEYNASAELQIAIDFLRRQSDSRGAKWLGLLGVDRCIVVPSLHSTLASTVLLPQRWPATLPAPSLLLNADSKCPVHLRTTGIAVVSGSLQRVTDPLHWKYGPAFLSEDPRAGISPVASAQTADPSLAWVRSELWSWISPEVAAATPGAVLTWSRVPLPVPVFSGGLSAMKFYADGAALVTNGGTVIRLPQQKVAWLVLPRGTRWVARTGKGFIVCDLFAPASDLGKGSVSPKTLRTGEVKILPFNNQTLSASGTQPLGKFWVLLKQRFSPLWTMRVRGGTVKQHVVAGGYANAWRVRCTQRCHFTITYAPQPTVQTLNYISLASWGFCCLLWWISAIASRREASLA